jgi:hypothetical protein
VRFAFYEEAGSRERGRKAKGTGSIGGERRGHQQRQYHKNGAKKKEEGRWKKSHVNYC